MQPVNTKSLFAFTTQLMDDLAQGKITPIEANAQGKLISKAVNLLDYEVERYRTLKEFEKDKDSISFRNIELKPFSDTTLP